MKILALADLHLCEKKPKCRLDEEDWILTQESVMNFIADIAKEYAVDCVIIAGDVFDGWKTNSIEFLLKCHKWFKTIGNIAPVMTIAGNHDSLGGLESELHKTPYGFFIESGALSPIADNDLISTYLYTDTGKEAVNGKVCVAHTGLWYKEKPYATAPDSGNVDTFVKNCLSEKCKLLISGHYHNSFICKIGNCTVVNCGSTFRMRADQINYKPVLWVIDVDTVTDKPTIVEKVAIPLKYEIRRDYIDDKNATEAHLEELIGSINGDFEVTLNIKDNFKKLVKDHDRKNELELLYERLSK